MNDKFILKEAVSFRDSTEDSELVNLAQNIVDEKTVNSFNKVVVTDESNDGIYVKRPATPATTVLRDSIEASTLEYSLMTRKDTDIGVSKAYSSKKLQTVKNAISSLFTSSYIAAVTRLRKTCIQSLYSDLASSTDDINKYLQMIEPSLSRQYCYDGNYIYNSELQVESIRYNDNVYFNTFSKSNITDLISENMLSENEDGYEKSKESLDLISNMCTLYASDLMMSEYDLISSIAYKMIYANNEKTDPNETAILTEDAISKTLGYFSLFYETMVHVYENTLYTANMQNKVVQIDAANKFANDMSYNNPNTVYF